MICIMLLESSEIEFDRIEKHRQNSGNYFEKPPLPRR